MTETRTDTYVKYAWPAKSDRCAIFDMDDTLCHYDKSLRLPNCDSFEAREEELARALSLAQEGVDIIIMTARPCWTTYKTFSWLKAHGLRVKRLYVKNRKNWDVAPHNLKTEMLQDILQTYEVVSFHDDAPLTVRAAQELGVNAVLVPGNESYWEQKAEAMGWV